MHQFEIEELACKITGLDYDEIEADERLIEEALIDQFGCDFNQFSLMINRLAPLINISDSALT